MNQYPSQAKLRELFEYDPLSGSLISIDGSSESIVYVSEDSKTIHKNTNFNGKSYNTKKLVWIYHNGEITAGKSVKSIAGAYSSRIEDLVLSCNSGNISRQSNSKGKSIYKGVHIINRKSGVSYICQFSYDGNTENPEYIGTFSTEAAAAACYDFWAITKFGSHAITNGVSCDFEMYRRRLGLPSKIARSGSGYKGVYKNKLRWMSKIKKEYIGTFDTKEEAARAYNIAAREYYGGHAILNDIPDPLGQGDIF